MKKLSIFFAFALASSLHAAELSYNIGAVSLYKSSGVDQDYSNASGSFDEQFRPAVQGGVYADLGNGFYVGNWNSTGTFGAASLEIDFYGGYAGTIDNDVNYNLGYAHYVYPRETSWNGGEIYLSINRGAFTVKVTNGLNGSLLDGSAAKGRLALSYDLDLAEQLRMTFAYGIRNKAAGNFNDFAVSATRTLGEGRALTLTYSGATPVASEVARKARLVFGIKQDF